MVYKILYIEDLDPGSIIHDLQGQGFVVEHHQPKTFENTLKAVDGCSLLLIDFRLTADKIAIFDAPTIAQTLRTLNSDSHKDIPIILISSEGNILDYYNDLTSRDLFDFSITKLDLSSKIEKYCKRFESLIAGYELIKKSNYNIQKVLSIPEEIMPELDYRIFEKLNNDIFKSDVFAFSSFILNNLIKTIGPLIGEDVLAARLGVSKESTGWIELKQKFEQFKYKGIFSTSYNRWWSIGLLNWWKEKENITLRRLPAEERVVKLKTITSLDLKVQERAPYAQSSNFWTICKDSLVPIDPIDGLELYKKELLAWQDTEYISIASGIAPKKYNGKKEPMYIKYLKPIERKKLREIKR